MIQIVMQTPRFGENWEREQKELRESDREQKQKAR